MSTFTSLLLAISLASVHLISAEAKDSNMNNNIPIPSADDDGATRHLLELSSKCHNTLLASATSTGRLHPENYFVFTDGLSNGYYTQHNMTTYSELPLSNKYSFVTLSCVCSSNDRIFKGSRVGGGGSGSDSSNTDEKCCQGVRANINIASMMENEYEYVSYVNDICSMTLHAIGVENVLPPTGEEPYRPGEVGGDGGGDSNDEKVEEEEDGEEEVMDGSAPQDPEKIKVTVETSSGEDVDDIDRTSSSATANAVSVVTQPNTNDDNTNASGGLSIGALSGIFVATIVVGLVLFGLIVTSSQKKTKNNNSDAEEDDSVSESGGSYVGVVNENDNHEEEDELNSSYNDEVNNDNNSTTDVTLPPSRRACKYRE